MTGFKLKRRKLEHSNGERNTVRLTNEAYNVLVDMANESTISMSKIASKAVMYAYEHLEYEE